MTNIDDYLHNTHGHKSKITVPYRSEDCDMLEVCKKLGATYNKCFAKSNPLFSDRCSAAERQNFMIQYKELEQRKNEFKRMELQNQKDVRRSWWQLLVAAILGGAATLLGEFLFNLLRS